jgi:hypothetical protein
VNLARYLTEERIDMALGEHFDEKLPATHERLVERMAALLVTSPDIVNATKLGNDLVNRERRAPSLPGHGVALPHVRTLQARRLVIALVGPPYDDKAYLGVYRTLGERLQQPEWTHSILSADLPGEVLRAMATA